MNELFKKYLLASVAVFSPPDVGGGGENPDQGDDRIELQDDDDETVTDPVDEDDHTEQDDDEDTGGEDNSAARGAGGDDSTPARQSRGDRQFGELRRQARERAEENARLTRELAELRGQITTLRQPVQQETAAQRAERLALMSPEERIQETVNEALRAHEQRSQTLQTQLMDQSDRVAFEARATNNPLFKKLSSEIERRLADLRSRGQNLPRETIATYLIGERVLAQQGKSKPAADARRRQQRAAPVRSQGDTTVARQRRGGAPVTAEDYEAQFGDVTI